MAIKAKGRTALITGVTRGLGLRVAERLLDKGWRICGVSRSESDGWRALQGRYPGQTEWRRCDLSVAGDIDEFMAGDALPLSHPVHAFVNNAAMVYDDLVTNVQRAKLEAMFAANVTGPMLLTRHVLRNMVLHGTPGAIVHVSSVTVKAGAKGLAMYAATKGALEAFSKSIAREWGTRGIRSNCILPGYMATDMTAAIASEQREKLQRRAALGHGARVDSVAATIEFLLGDEAGSITGQNIVVDAGFTA